MWPTGFKRNWGGGYDIFEDDGEIIGQQFATDTGNMDILAISKDRRELLVVELKKGQAADKVVGQILRYMGYAAQELAEEGQTVKGIIITQEDDLRLRRALSVTPNVSILPLSGEFQADPFITSHMYRFYVRPPTICHRSKPKMRKACQSSTFMDTVCTTNATRRV